MWHFSIAHICGIALLHTFVYQRIWHRYTLKRTRCLCIPTGQNIESAALAQGLATDAALQTCDLQSSCGALSTELMMRSSIPLDSLQIERPSSLVYPLSPLVETPLEMHEYPLYSAVCSPVSARDNVEGVHENEEEKELAEDEGIEQDVTDLFVPLTAAQAQTGTRHCNETSFDIRAPLQLMTLNTGQTRAHNPLATFDVCPERAQTVVEAVAVLPGAYMEAVEVVQPILCAPSSDLPQDEEENSENCCVYTQKSGMRTQKSDLDLHTSMMIIVPLSWHPTSILLEDMHYHAPASLSNHGQDGTTRNRDECHGYADTAAEKSRICTHTSPLHTQKKPAHEQKSPAHSQESPVCAPTSTVYAETSPTRRGEDEHADLFMFLDQSMQSVSELENAFSSYPRAHEFAISNSSSCDQSMFSLDDDNTGACV